MQSLNFDESLKEYAINGDESRVIRFNPSDISFVKRANESLKKMQEVIKKLKPVEVKVTPDGNPMDEIETAAEYIKVAEKAMFDAVDELFYPGVAELVFQNVSPLATVNGVTVFENFINAFIKMVKPAMEAEQKKTEEKARKYKKVYDKLPIA